MRLSRSLIRFACAALALVASAPRGGPRDATADPPRCTCRAGKACWHYLNAPMRPPEDRCRCPVCTPRGTCGGREAPEGWSEECMGSSRAACFWLRHGASWSITCSICAASDDCRACAKIPGAPDAGARAALARQTERESKTLGKLAGPGRDPIAIAWSPHFYVVSDEARRKVRTQGGGERTADLHETVHLTLERAEKAYDDWVAAFGDDLAQGRIAFYVTGSVQRREAFGGAYFDAPGSTSMYGDDPASRMAGGFAGAGLPIPLDRRGDDRDLHAFLRHMLGHMFFSRWHGSHVDPTNCPPWASAAAAEWLERSEAPFADGSVYWSECNGEGKAASGSGADWEAKARAIAAGPRDSVGRLLGLSAEFHMTANDYVHAWSWFDVMLREDRVRWIALLRALREGKDRGASFEAALHASPDAFDRRWADRMLGRRDSMADTPGDRAPPAGASVPARLAAARSPAELLDVLRGLGHVEDVAAAEAVANAAGPESDAVRESVVRVLAATRGEAATWLRTGALASKDAMTRAHAARALGVRKEAAARAALEPLLLDAHWLARANAATALSALADPAAAPALVAAAADADPRAAIAKADALATFGGAAGAATAAVAAGLKSPLPPLVLAAVRSLSRIGTADAVDPLIDALESRTGPLAAEVHAALKTITHETFGPNASSWRTWWKAQKPKGIPKDLPPTPNPEDARYAPPKKKSPADEATYYGRRVFSSRVVFVLDVSSSMTTLMTPPEGVEKELGPMPPGPRIEIARRRLEGALEKLPDRARVNLVFFSTEAKRWRPSLVTIGAARKAAIDAVRSATPDGETNIYDALRASFGLQDRTLAAIDLDDVPDTIYFLTDGEPTRGEITARRELLDWVREVNRYVKARIHVIGMGSMNIDLDFLDRLATENGGETILLPDR